MMVCSSFRNAAAAAPNGEIDANCATDYLIVLLINISSIIIGFNLIFFIQIPNGVADATVLNAAGVVLGSERFCGRTLTDTGTTAVTATVCSKQT